MRKALWHGRASSFRWRDQFHLSLDPDTASNITTRPSRRRAPKPPTSARCAAQILLDEDHPGGAGFRGEAEPVRRRLPGGDPYPPPPFALSLSKGQPYTPRPIDKEAASTGSARTEAEAGKPAPSDIEAGMAEMSEKFREKGGEIYLPAAE
jgi:phosphomethylpyrimidine synthase